MTTATMPSADVVFDTLFGYQRSGALKTAIELEIFTLIDTGAKTAAEIASRCNAAERGIRILCDYLTTIGLLTKSGGSYGLTPESAAFLSKQSRAYLGTTMSDVRINRAARSSPAAPAGCDTKRRRRLGESPGPFTTYGPMIETE